MRKKRKGGKRNRAGNQIFASKKPDQFEIIQTDIEKFTLPLFDKKKSNDNDFLCKEKAIDHKKTEIEFEKEAIAEDFTIVKNSQKRCENMHLVSNSQQ